MNNQQIDQLIDTFFIKTAKGNVNPRVQQVVVRLMGDLFKAIEDLERAGVSGGYRYGPRDGAAGRRAGAGALYRYSF